MVGCCHQTKASLGLKEAHDVPSHWTTNDGA
jgi:hypothetical protein